MMNSSFELDDTQQMLRDSLARYLEEHYTLEQRREQLREPAGVRTLWHGLARELGLLGAGFPEAQGGSGGGFTDQLVILEALGGALAAEPYLSTMLVSAGVLRRTPGALAARILSGILSGDTLVGCAFTEPHSRQDPLQDVRTTLRAQGDALVLEGRKAVVHGGPWADHFIVSAREGAGDALSLVLIARDTPGLQRRDFRSVDGTHVSELQFDGLVLSDEQRLGDAGSARELLATVLDEATLGVCAESIGILQRLLNDTLNHVRTRKQFGVPIASFQALQHRLADMYIALELASATTATSAQAIGSDASARARAVSSAKVAVNRACRIVGQGAVQLHGGMGMTEELAIGHFFRRATQIEQMFGSLSWHQRRVGQLSEA